MGFQLMYLAHEGNAEGIRELLDAGADPNFRDSDGRTALHISAYEGHAEVVDLLLDRGTEAAVEDQWGSTPLADAMHCQNLDVIMIFEKHGPKHKGTSRKATWRGILVAVKKLDDDTGIQR